MTHLVIDTDVLALSIIFISLLSIHLYFKISDLRKVIKAYMLQAQSARKEHRSLEVKLNQLKLQNEILREAK